MRRLRKEWQIHLAPRRGLLACALAAALLAALPQAAGAVTANRQRALNAAAFVTSQQRANGAICAFSCQGSTADAVVSLVAARTGGPVVRKAMGYLRRQVEGGHISSIGLEAKVVMAAVAAGATPRSFGGTNLVAAIRGTQGGDGHLGDAAVYDQALAVLALRAAGADASDAGAWLEQAQCADGGWQYDLPPGPHDDAHCYDATAPAPGDAFTTDSNTTSLAIQALGPGGAASAGLSFLTTVRDGSDGWGYSQCCTTTDANSTALVIQAYAAAGTPTPAGGFAALRDLQLACGAWPYQAGGNADIGATIGGVLGILRLPLPVGRLDPAFPMPSPGACG